MNVESDFARIAPLVEAALHYSQNHKVFFLDVSKSQIRGILPSMNQLALNCFRGGNLVKRIRKYLVSRNVHVIKFKKSLLPDSYQELTSQEELSLKLAIRNQNIDKITNTYDAQDYFEKKKDYYLNLKLNLDRILAEYSIQRLFVWNGRFEMSTVVAISGESQNVKVTKVEWGSQIDNSLEIFREPPRNRFDAWSRAHQFQKEIEDGVRSLPKHDDLALFVSEMKVNRFTSRFNDEELIQDLETQRYVVFYTSSFWESATYGQYVSEIDQDEIESVKAIIEVANEFGLLVVIRIHPNPWSLNYEQFESALWKKSLLGCKSKNYIVIDANSSLDSYVLAEKSLAIFTVWSTIGYECLARGVPTFFVSDYYWESCKASHKYDYDQDKLRRFFGHPHAMSLEPFRFLLLYKKYYGFRFNYLSKTSNGSIFFRNSFLMKEKNEFGIFFVLLSKAKKLLVKI